MCQVLGSFLPVACSLSPGSLDEFSLTQSYLVLPVSWNHFLSSPLTERKGGEGAKQVGPQHLHDKSGCRALSVTVFKGIYWCVLSVKRAPTHTPDGILGIKLDFHFCSLRAGVGRLRLQGRYSPTTWFCTACKLRMIFVCFKWLKKKKNIS